MVTQKDLESAATFFLQKKMKYFHFFWKAEMSTKTILTLWGRQTQDVSTSDIFIFGKNKKSKLKKRREEENLYSTAGVWIWVRLVKANKRIPEKLDMEIIPHSSSGIESLKI